MQTFTRLRFHPISWLVLVSASGLVLGPLLGARTTGNPATELSLQIFQVGTAAALALLRGLAVPLLITTAILGSVGLEPMRRLPTLAGKTLLWIFGGSLLAFLIGWGASYLHGPIRSALSWSEMRIFEHRPTVWETWPNDSHLWFGLVAVSLGFGYYRNQIQEGPAKTFTRLCQGVQEAAHLLLHKVGVFLPGILLFTTVSGTAQLASVWGSAMFPAETASILGALAVAGLIYLLSWMLLTWWVARVPMWRVLPALLPAMCLGLTSRSPEATFPLTLATLRRAGVSDRVAGVSLPLGIVLQRDGVVLGLTVLACCYRHHSSWIDDGWTGWLWLGASLCVLGCGLDALGGDTSVAPLIFQNPPGETHQAEVLETIFVVSLGGAISVFTQACIAVILARGEGDYWVPGPPPSADELQGLKTDLELAEG